MCCNRAFYFVLFVFLLSSSYLLPIVLLLSCYRLPSGFLRFALHTFIRTIAEHYPKEPKGELKDHLRRTKGGFVFIALIFFVLLLRQFLLAQFLSSTTQEIAEFHEAALENVTKLCRFEWHN